MGVAAYNRGSLAIRNGIDAEAYPVEFDCMDALNALAKYADAGQPFSNLLFVQGNGGWWAVSESDRDGFGFWYRDLREAVKRWNCAIVGYSLGEWLAVPLPRVRRW